MVPIHESDVAENRWNVAEWSTVELWEKVELQLKKRRRWTIGGVIVLFLALSAIPIVKDRTPKWRSLRVARQVAEEFNVVKLEAARSKRAVQFSVSLDETGLQVQSQFGSSCQLLSSGAEAGVPSSVRFPPEQMRGLALLDPVSAGPLGLERITRAFCFDPVATPIEGREVAIGWIPVKDLTELRTDRISFVFFQPASSEVTFD